MNWEYEEIEEELSAQWIFDHKVVCIVINRNAFTNEFDFFTIHDTFPFVKGKLKSKNINEAKKEVYDIFSEILSKAVNELNSLRQDLLKSIEK